MYLLCTLMKGNMKIFRSAEPFGFEGGAVLPGIEIAYHTYGTLNEDGSNVVWVCHALTASSDAAGWWPGLIGDDCTIDPSKYFIVCANILGSCYGTTGAASVNPLTGEPYYLDFPVPTIRDMVKAHMLLRKALGINRIHLLMGGSMGGYQALEWAVMEPEIIDRLFLIATSPAESAWGQAIHTAQRMAVEADATWKDRSETAGANGLKAARAIGMLTYRNYEIMVRMQQEPDPEKILNFRAESYIRYQGEKLVKRFNAQCYWILTRSMDTHQLSRGRGGNLETVLAAIKQPALIMGVASDILCPPAEQQFMAKHMPNAVYKEIDSAYGHDGFLVESGMIGGALAEFLKTT